MKELYAAIWRTTGRQQMFLILLSVVVAGLAAVPLDFQKKIVNAISNGTAFDQILVLGLQMALVILVSLSLKWLLGYRAGLVGEGVIRLIRATKVKDWAKPEHSPGEDSKKGTLANIVSSESENIGKFVGSAFSEPLLQFGTLVSVIG